MEKFLDIVLTYLSILASAIGVHGLYNRGSYDFIVVGSGVAGSTVASRLSDSGKHSVLLLEAGKFPDSRSEIPVFIVDYIVPGNFTKGYRTVPQANAALDNNGIVEYITGRAVGGGSVINGMTFNKGHPRDYSAWAKITGDPTLTYKNMLKYFQRVQTRLGPWNRPTYAPGINTLYEAARYLGYPVVDPIAAQQISFSPREHTMRHGRRVSAFTGYIRPILATRPNLVVTTNAFVNRIVFKGHRAIGVIYTLKSDSGFSQQLFVQANKEIVVSAGTLESPALLLKSGVGPEDVLLKNGIPPVKYLPVGKNLQDHILVKLDFSIEDRSPSEVMIPKRDLTPENFALYNITGDGPYASVSGLYVQSFLASSASISEGKGDWADIQVEYFMGAGGPDYMATPELSMAGSEVQIDATVFLVRPKSVGWLTLNTNDPEGDPLIDFQYLTHPDDIDILVDGINQTLQFYESTPAFQRLHARLLRIPLPSCDHLRFRSLSYWKCYIRQRATTGLHAVGTCSMGRGSSDSNAVVDPNFKVIGIDRLRIVDGSVIPKIPNANTQAPIYALGEKASEIILQAWKVPGI